MQQMQQQAVTSVDGGGAAGAAVVRAAATSAAGKTGGGDGFRRASLLRAASPMQVYGATITEMVKSMRKVLTIVLSFLLYPKPLSWKYGLGGFAVLLSLAATHELHRRKGQLCSLVQP